MSAWRAIGQVYDEAVCRARRAEALTAEGQRDEARTELLQALRTATALKAEPLANEVRRVARHAHFELEPHHRTSRENPAGLTPREVEVLRLLALGHTNQQIAADLYISPGTASVHVSHIITKLGAANRTEAVAIARQQSLVG